MAQKYAPIQMPHHGHLPHGLQFRVPWRIHLKAWEQYAKLGHGAQTAERLAERGGFGLEELIILLAGENPWANNQDGRWATNSFGKWEE
jgi:hypothetical protein